jgi:putative FmdB family regulatory protein
VPIYEYRCAKCGRTFEYQQKIKDDPKTICEACGGALERLISNTAFTLKGSGWYKDLYSSPKPAAKESKESKSESKSEAKPAADPKPSKPKSDA